MSNPNFTVTMLAKGKVRLEMFGIIGPSQGGMIDTQTVSAALQEAGPVDEIELHINSKGGDAFEGMGIYNFLKEHPAKKSVVVHGIAASAASVVAMAGDTIRVPRTSRLMIHEPFTFAFGGRDALASCLKKLEAVQESTVAIYAERSKQTPAKVAELMKAETWMSGSQAVEMGFADLTDKASDQPIETVQQVAVTEDCRTHFFSTLSIAMSTTKEAPVAEPIVTPAVPVAPVAPVIPAAPQLTAADVATAVQNALKEEQSRTGAITAICQRVGRPDLASDFIVQNLSVADVNAKMVDVLCQARPPVGDAGGQAPPPAADPNVKFKEEYAGDKAAFMKAGITEADYVTSRRISAGDEQLLVRS